MKAKLIFTLALLMTCVLEINALNAQALNQLQNITPPLPDSAFVGRVNISPDEKHVVFTADASIEGVFELFSMPLSGGPLVPLTPGLANGERVDSFSITPDGQNVLVRGELRADGVIELFIVPIGGGRLRLLGPSLIESPFVELDADIGSIKLTPNGERVVYALQTNGFRRAELYSVGVEGGEPIRINDELVSGGSTSAFDITPDGQRVIYRADQIQDDAFELFSSSILGGGSTRLHPALPTTGSATEQAYRDVGSFQISPDGQHVVYHLSFSGFRRGELAIANVDGSTNQTIERLIDDFPTRFANVNQDGFTITPDGARIIYIADQEIDGRFELFSIPFQGGFATKISGDLQDRGDIEEFKISADSQHVVYRADADLDQLFKLFSLNLAQGRESVVTIDPEGVDSVSEDNFVLSSDSRSVVFEKLLDSEAAAQLFIAPIAAEPASGSIRPKVFSQVFNDRNEEGGLLVQSANSDLVTYVSPDGDGIFVARVGALAENDEALCFPIKASNDGFAVVCV